MKIVIPFANQGIFPPAKQQQQSLRLVLYPTQWSKPAKKN